MDLTYFAGVFALFSLLTAVEGGFFDLYCYRCHSNEKGCGEKLNWWLLQREVCDMDSPKCVKIIKRENAQMSYTRACLKDVVGGIAMMPIHTKNGCWGGMDQKTPMSMEQVEQIPDANFEVFCFCDEVNGCNSAPLPFGNANVLGVVLSIVITVVCLLRQ